MKTVKKLMLASVAALSIATTAHAAVVSLVTQVVGKYDPATGALTQSNPDISTNPGAAAYYKVNVLFNFASGGAGQDGFGNLAFNVTNLNGVSRAPTSNLGAVRPGWVASNPNWFEDPTDQSAGGHAIYSFNSDSGSGAAATDLQAITVSIDPNSPAIRPTPNSFASDPRPDFGKSTSQLMGSFWVLWNGTSQASVTTDLLQHSYYTANNAAGGGINVVDPTGTDNDTTVTFGAVGSVPEPTSLAFLAVGGLMAARRRRA